MEPEEIEAALATLTDPTTAPALAQALGYSSSTPISQACREGRIPGAHQSGRWIWLIPLTGVRMALTGNRLRPGWKSSK